MSGSLFKNGQQWLAGCLKQNAGSTLVYVRGNISKTVTGVIAYTFSEIIDDGSTSIASQQFDILIDRNELGMNPKPGDRIYESTGQTGRVFEVNHLHEEGYIKQDRCWRWSFPDGTMMRVHTKLIS